MVNNNKIKYDERAKQDLINGGVQLNLDGNDPLAMYTATIEARKIATEQAR